jgi:hypothetical protein
MNNHEGSNMAAAEAKLASHELWLDRLTNDLITLTKNVNLLTTAVAVSEANRQNSEKANDLLKPRVDELEKAQEKKNGAWGLVYGLGGFIVGCAVVAGVIYEALKK